jgi:hypothetical protein
MIQMCEVAKATIRVSISCFCSAALPRASITQLSAMRWSAMRWSVADAPLMSDG